MKNLRKSGVERLRRSLLASAVAAAFCLGAVPSVYAQDTQPSTDVSAPISIGGDIADSRDAAAIAADKAQIQALLARYPIGGDDFAAGIAELVVATPANVVYVLGALTTASDAQRRAAARGLAAVVQDLSDAGTDEAAATAQAIETTIARAIVCMTGDPTGVVCDDIGPNSEAFANAYLALQSDQATAAISSPASLPGPIGFTPPTSGPLGTNGEPANGGQSLFDTVFGGLQGGNSVSFTSPGAASASPTTL